MSVAKPASPKTYRRRARRRWVVRCDLSLRGEGGARFEERQHAHRGLSRSTPFGSMASRKGCGRQLKATLYDRPKRFARPNAARRVTLWVAAVGVSSRIGRAQADDAGTVPPPAVVQEVSVLGARATDPVPPKDAAVAGSVITRERLVGPGLEAQDVLRTQPGVEVTESGGFGAPATAAVRGATAADTPVYLAGVRLNDDVAGTADLSLVPVWLIDRIEVYRGNSPLAADRLGPGGAIFFEPRWPTRTMGGFGTYGGSWGAGKGWVYEGFRSGSVSALVGTSADRATNRYPFVNDHGTLFEPQNDTIDTRQNADETTLEGWGLARVELGGGATMDLLANGISREQGVPNLALVPTRRARERVDRELMSVSVRAPVGQGGTTLDARTSLVIGGTTYTDPLLELALYTQRLSIVGRRIEQTLGATTDLTSAIRIRPLVTVAHEGIERNPNDIPLGRARREFARAAAEVEARAVSWLTLHALASGECHHTGADPGAVCDVLEPTGRAGVEVGSQRLRVLTNFGRYVRVPTLGEVYGVSSTVHGNPALAPETGLTGDFGVRAQAPRGPLVDGAYLDAFVFARWADGLVAYERTGQGYVTPYNVGRARVLGIEILTGIAITPIVRIEVAATALDPRDTSPGRTTVNDILPYRSRFIAAPRIRADWKTKSRSGVSAIGGEVRALYQSSRYVDPAGLGVIDEQATVDVEGDVALFDGLLTVRARVADLFDAPRTDIIGYPLPGRSAYAGLEASW
jgi:vitamin B12 transporter